MAPDELDAHEARHQPRGNYTVCQTCEALWPCASARTATGLREARAERDEWRDNATTLRGLLDNHAHNDAAMEQALRDVTVERDEAVACAVSAERDLIAARERIAELEGLLAMRREA